MCNREKNGAQRRTKVDHDVSIVTAAVNIKVCLRDEAMLSSKESNL